MCPRFRASAAPVCQMENGWEPSRQISIFSLRLIRICSTSRLWSTFQSLFSSCVPPRTVTRTSRLWCLTLSLPSMPYDPAISLLFPGNATISARSFARPAGWTSRPRPTGFPSSCRIKPVGDLAGVVNRGRRGRRRRPREYGGTGAAPPGGAWRRVESPTLHNASPCSSRGSYKQGAKRCSDVS